jgi:hypothetical protein
MGSAYLDATFSLTLAYNEWYYLRMGMFGFDRVGFCYVARRDAQSRKKGTGITAKNISAPSFARTTAFAA